MSSVRLTLARGRCYRCHFSWTSGERTLADSAARYRSRGHFIRTICRGDGESRNSGHLGGPLAFEGLCFLLSARGLIISLPVAHPRATEGGVSLLTPPLAEEGQHNMPCSLPSPFSIIVPFPPQRSHRYRLNAALTTSTCNRNRLNTTCCFNILAVSLTQPSQGPFHANDDTHTLNYIPREFDRRLSIPAIDDFSFPPSGTPCSVDYPGGERVPGAITSRLRRLLSETETGNYHRYRPRTWPSYISHVTHEIQ
ncbi:hypothetical protein CBL_06515 [Carabus blaptoides fortunei]